LKEKELMENQICTNNYLLIKIVDPAKETLSGIVIAEQYQEKPRWGWVLDVGEGLADLNGVVHKPPFEVGDLVYFMKHAPEKMDYSDIGLGVLHFISEGDVFSKIKVATLDDGSKQLGELIPIGNYINILPLEDKVKTKTAGGIYLPDQVIERPSIAKVLAVGPGQRTASGFHAPVVRPGQIIRYRAMAAQTVKFDDLGVNRPPATIIPYGDVLAIETENLEQILKDRLNSIEGVLK